MVSTNSALTPLARLTSPSQNVGGYSTHTAEPGLFPPLSNSLRPPARCLPLLVMATARLCASSLAGVAGIGIFPSHVPELALKVLSSKVRSRRPGRRCPLGPQGPLAPGLGGCFPGRGYAPRKLR